MKRLYAKTHEWALLEEGKDYLVGISDYAQIALGDIVFVNLPSIGDSVKQGQSFGDVESVKAVSDLICPVSGKVVAINDALLNAPELLNSDPLNTWIIQVEGSVNEQELMDEATYLALDKDH
jgi:glycine cleavage system H protein